MNKRQLELQNQLYTLFEEDKHPAFITNLIEKVELGVIYADLTENEINEVFNEFKEMHDLSEGFFKDMKDKSKTNMERIFKGIFVKEIQTEDGSTKYKKVDKEDAEYIIKGRKLYTLEGEFIKNISPVVYRETFPELSGKEAEIRIKDKESLKESETLTETVRGSLLKWSIKHMNEKQIDNCFKSLMNKLQHKANSQYQKEITTITREFDKKNYEEKKEILLQIVDKTYAKNPKGGKQVEKKLSDELGVQNLTEEYMSDERKSQLKRAATVGLTTSIINLIAALLFGIWFPFLSIGFVIDMIFSLVVPQRALEKMEERRYERSFREDAKVLTESVTYVDNAGRVKTSSTEDYVQSMHEYDTKYQIPVIPSVVSKNLKKKNLKENINLEDGE